MRKDLIINKKIYSSFFSCPEDVRKILEGLFVYSKPYSDDLKKLLIINNPDCLSSIKKEEYNSIINRFSLADLMDKGYVRLNPKIMRGTHEEIKAYILVAFDNFSPNDVSPRFLDYTFHFDIICNNDAWVLDNLAVRPLMIAGYIDGLLRSMTEQNKYLWDNSDNQARIKLTGIGEYELLGCNQVVLNEDFSMYSLAYRGMHFTQAKQEATSRM